MANAQRAENSVIVGRLLPIVKLKEGVMLPSTESNVYFIPADMRFPKLLISRLDLPFDYIRNPSTRIEIKKFIKQAALIY